MDNMLNALVLVSPVGLAILGCLAFIFALAAREAMGRERGAREAEEQAHEAILQVVTGKNVRQATELDHYRRLLDCCVDAMIAGTAALREGAVPSPGRILEGFCPVTPAWKRELAECTGLKLEEVERLLRSGLPMTPGLARRLESFTGAPARYWEYLWRLHDEHRMDPEPTTILDLSGAARAFEHAARAGGTALVAPPAPIPTAAQAADPPPPTVRAAPLAPPAKPSVRRAGIEAHPPVVPHPDLAVRAQGDGLPAPPIPRLRGPVASRADAGSSPARRAATLTDFPLQREEGLAASSNDWSEIERSVLNVTLPGMGGE